MRRSIAAPINKHSHARSLSYTHSQTLDSDRSIDHERQMKRPVKIDIASKLPHTQTRRRSCHVHAKTTQDASSTTIKTVPPLFSLPPRRPRRSYGVSGRRPCERASVQESNYNKRDDTRSLRREESDIAPAAKSTSEKARLALPQYILELPLPY